MGVGEDFSTFCSNLKMSSVTVDNIQSRYSAITKRINSDYWDSSSNSLHSLYVGSYGRKTEIFTSDIDMLVILPYSTYKQFDAYAGNGQSALIQDVKASLQRTYSTSHCRGDGQVICINFTDGINFEIVPAFENTDNSFTYPDAHDGGKWKTTNPRKEIEAMNLRNNSTNKNLKRLCRMVRTWKSENSVSMSGILIDTLAYDFIASWEYRDKSYLYYDYLSRDFFKYLANLSTDRTYWYAPGSNRIVHKDGEFHYKAKTAYNKSLEAIQKQNDGYEYSARSAWREIYGSKFPR